MFLQQTLKTRAKVEGIGLHSGAPATLHFVPAPPETGVYFVRSDLPGRPFLKVSAKNVSATGYATTLGGPEFSVSTIEHCLSALSALRIDNLFIELDGPEIPIIDGSAEPYLRALLRAGIIEQDRPRKYLRVVESVTVTDGDKRASLNPYQGLKVKVTIDFPHPVIGFQSLELDINQHSFEREIAPARTFGFIKEVEELQKKGLALGASLQNAIGLDDKKILNPEGLRFANEFVRHKALDALGDLVTLEHPLLGQVELYKAGHDLMNKLALKVMSTPQNFVLTELGTP